MKLLIITQKIDLSDPVLEFFQNWIIEFQKQGVNPIVICLQKGEHHLPSNIPVFSLGKDRLRQSSYGESKGAIERLRYLLNFYKYIISERNNYGTVFVHMNQTYVLLGWPVFKLLGKKVTLWYAHGQVSLSLRIAEKLADIIFTSTPTGFRIPSKKVRIMGQGIDVNKFVPDINKSKDDELILSTVGRIARVKNISLMIETVRQLLLPSFRVGRSEAKADGGVGGGLQAPPLGEGLPRFAKALRGGEGERSEQKGVKLFIAGNPVTPEELKELDELKRLTEKLNLNESVSFDGPVNQTELPAFLNKSDIFLNTSATGSMDKTVLEALACGVPTITSNPAFVELSNKLPKHFLTMLNNSTPNSLAEEIKIIQDLSSEELKQITTTGREYIAKNFAVESLIGRIVKELGSEN